MFTDLTVCEQHEWSDVGKSLSCSSERPSVMSVNVIFSSSSCSLLVIDTIRQVNLKYLCKVWSIIGKTNRSVSSLLWEHHKCVSPLMCLNFTAAFSAAKLDLLIQRTTILKKNNPSWSAAHISAAAETPGKSIWHLYRLPSTVTLQSPSSRLKAMKIFPAGEHVHFSSINLTCQLLCAPAYFTSYKYQ